MTLIKHIVISGGGPTIFTSIGALQTLEKNNLWNIENIESIYGTSAGGIIAVILCLKYSWDMINDYILNRPWHEAYKVNIHNIFDSFKKRGIYDRNAIDIFFKPLFAAKDLSLDITLKEFYDYSKIDLHFFTLELNNFKIEDVSHVSHPDLCLLTAIQMTCALPILFAPVFLDNKCYMDGGVICNYPLNYCIQKYKNLDEILSLKNSYDNSSKNHEISQQSSIIEYIMNFLFKVIYNLSTEKEQEKIPNEVILNDMKFISLSYVKSTLSSVDVRKELFNKGIKSADDFLSKRESNELKDSIQEL